MNTQISHVESFPILNSARELYGVDVGLLEEAYRRARAAPLNRTIDSSRLLSAIFEEARRGSRDLYSLVRAAGRQPHAMAAE